MCALAVIILAVALEVTILRHFGPWAGGIPRGLARGGARSVLMAQALPPIDLVNAIFVDYSLDRAV